MIRRVRLTARVKELCPSWPQAFPFSSRCLGLMPPGRCCQGEAGITCFVTQQDVLVTASWLHKWLFPESRKSCVTPFWDPPLEGHSALAPGNRFSKTLYGVFHAPSSGFQNNHWVHRFLKHTKTDIPTNHWADWTGVAKSCHHSQAQKWRNPGLERWLSG